MKKLFLAILMVLMVPVASYATTYYACIAGNINAANAWEDAVGCDGTTFTYGTGGFPASGSILEANAQAMTVNVDPGPNGKVHLKNTAGGGYAAATSLTPITINADITAVGATCLTVTGTADASPALTIVGNVVGGDSATYYGVADSHTVGTVVFQGNATSGGNATGHGYRFAGATGSVSMTGNATGGATAGSSGLYLGAAGTATITGSCIGGGVSAATGCFGNSTGSITVIGNLIWGDRGAPASGLVVWQPVAPGSGVGSYVQTVGGTDVFVGLPTTATAANQAANIKAGEYFIKSDTGVSTVGTSAAGSGGAWAF